MKQLVMRMTDIGASAVANAGFEAKLWQTADALRNNLDVAEYKRVVLGLIFLEFISDAVEAKHASLEADRVQDAATKPTSRGIDAQIAHGRP